MDVNGFWKWVGFVSQVLRKCGAVCLVGMSVLTCVDVVGRFFKHPVFGSVELVSFMGVLVVALALPFTHQSNGHIGVELIVRKLSARKRALIDACTGLLGFVLFVLISWRMVVYGIIMKQSGQVSMNLQLPEYLIVLIVAFCCMVLSATILKGVIDAIGQMRSK